MVRRTVLGLSLAASLLAAAAPAVALADSKPSAIEMFSNCVGGSLVTVTTLSAPTNPGPDPQFLSFVTGPNCTSTMTVLRVP